MRVIFDIDNLVLSINSIVLKDDSLCLGSAQYAGYVILK